VSKDRKEIRDLGASVLRQKAEGPCNCHLSGDVEWVSYKSGSWEDSEIEI
jgi:hypothetical protein